MFVTKLLFSIIVLLCLIVYFWLYYVPSSYVKSSIDNKYYLVQDRADKQEVADTLAYIRRNIKILTKNMMKTAPEKYKPYVERLDKKLNHVVITENIKDFYYTSYSVNKGEQLVFCMRSRKTPTINKKHDINLMMYVVLHEISHIACPEYGHGKLFKEIFKYITESAISLGIYVPIDFKSSPTEYCGMTITDSIV